MAHQNEQDIRLQILNTLLTCPHRDLAQIATVHAEMLDRDPRFYVRLAAWYNQTGAVRDHKEIFAATLIRSNWEGHRDVGLAMFRELPPYQVARVVDWIHGRVTRRRVRLESGKSGRRQRAQAAIRGQAPAAVAAQPAAPVRQPGGLARVVAALRGRARRNARIEAAQAAPVPAPPTPPEPTPKAPAQIHVERTGLFKNLPRSLKTELRRYLREREAKPQWLDECAITARGQMKRLYALAHIAPSARAQAILFENRPPAGSKLFQLKALARAESPAEQARVILEQKIPYRIASSVVRAMTPTVLLALIEAMTPQELINNMGSLKRRGAMENPELKRLIEAKLGKAQTDQRVSAYKAKEAVKAAGLSSDLEVKLDQVTEAQIKARGRITRPTALLIDKSGSMSEAIEIGKRIGAMLSAVCEAPLYVYAFDTIAVAIEPGGTDLASWEKALRGVQAGGGTSCGVSVERLRQKRQYVEQIVLVTDEGENTAPHFLDALRKYREEVKADPNICIVRTRGACDLLHRQLNAAGIPSDVFQFAGDYYALPNLIPMLSQASKLELLMEIMEYPLPQRRAA